MALTGLIESILADAPLITILRRDLHAHPELGFQELRTSDLIAKALTDWGIPVHRGMGGTGVVGVIEGRSNARAVGLRADMDALPINERNTFGHASQHSGKMHACGHDGHMAMLLSAAKYLAKHRDFDGTVVLVFQPAEEGGAGGAREMMKDGLFERFPVQAIFGVHNWPGLEAGVFAVAPGPIFASSNTFRIVVRGKGSHAGMPHAAIDPIPIACQLVQALQTIVSRNSPPPEAGVISATMIHAGEAINVIPDCCEIRGTVRTFSGTLLDLIERRMRQISEAVCAAFDARCEFTFDRKYPPLVNHVSETEFVRTVLIEVAGVDQMREFAPTMLAEDFSFYLRDVPGCYFVIGNGGGSHREAGHGDGSCMLHNPSYDFNDSLIPIGAEMWVRLVKAWFNRATIKGAL